MTQRGLLCRQLMEFLLSYKVEASNIPIIINTMLKYGLIIKLEHEQNATRKTSELLTLPLTEYYLVPVRLPDCVENPATFQDGIWNYGENYNSCYFVFSTATAWVSLQSIQSLRLGKECFLPRGLMERLIG